MKNLTPSIGVVTLKLSNSGLIPLSNLIKVLDPLSSEIHVVTGSNLENLDHLNLDHLCWHQIIYKPVLNVFSRIFQNLMLQFWYSLKIIRILNKVDLFIFFIGGDILVLPMLILKLFRKRRLLLFAGSPITSSKAKNDNLVGIQSILSKSSCILASSIILYSSSMIEEIDLEPFSDKIIISHIHFLDYDKFKIEKEYSTRKNYIGYVGRLSEEKGILNFIDVAISITNKDDYNFMIIGNGPLEEKIKDKVNNHNLENSIDMVGWVSREELPSYLNRLKLLVLPSYTEGLPKVVLEAMACGTPLLTTKVGAIPEIISDNVNGFLMENNSPACIEKNIIRVFDCSNINDIIKNSQDMVRKEFSYENVIKKWKEILDET